MARKLRQTTKTSPAQARELHPDELQVRLQEQAGELRARKLPLSHGLEEARLSAHVRGKAQQALRLPSSIAAARST